MKFKLLTTLVIGLSITSAKPLFAMELNDQAYGILQSTFNYDKSFPLDSKTTSSFTHKDQEMENIVFESFLDGEVPGFLAIPTTGKAPHPVVLLIHGITAKKEDWLTDTFTHGGQITNGLLNKGYAVLALDAQYHGARLGNNDFRNPATMVFRDKWLKRYSNLVTQTIIDYRRAIDYLETREEIDTNRVGVLGYSMGGQMAFILAANEPRVKSVVACVVPETKGMPIEARTFAPKLGGLPLIMMMAKQDEFYTEEEAKALFELIPGDNKTLKLYDSGHSLPEKYTREAVSWITDNL